MAKKDKKNKDKKKEEKEEEFVDPHEPQLKNPFYVWKLISFDGIWILFGLLGGGILGALPILLYLILGQIIDTLTPTSGAEPSDSDLVRDVSALLQTALFQAKINRLAMFMAIIAAVSFAGAFLQYFCMHLAHDRIGNRLKQAYFDSLLNQEIGYFDMKKVGELINTMSETMELIQEGYSNKLGEAFKSIVQTILGIAFAINSGWKMALVMLSAGPLLALVLGSVGGFIRMFQKRIGDINGKAAAIANEVIGSMRTVRSMDGEEREKDRFTTKLYSAQLVYFLKAVSLGSSIGLAYFFIWAVIALAFWFGGKLTIEGEITLGALFEVYGLNLIAIMGLAGALQALPDVGKSSAAVAELMKVVRRVPAMRPSGGLTPNTIEGNIVFEHVNFSYPTRPNVQVLKDFNLEIKPGQTVALVGASGSGKSTIVGLIEKFYEAESGTITLDGNNLADIDPRWLHRNIGIVTQEPTLFAASIRSNITYAITGTGKTVTEEDIINAAKAANAHDFIMQLPDNYNTALGERGVSLSGGQKQRIAIARAMIQDPKLLLLDEATSALDTESESLVQDALNRLMKGRTTIVIAHRLSTIVDSDVICVMSKGEMKEKGTHQELIQIPNGYYFKLAQKQMKFGQSDSASDVESDSDEESSTSSSNNVALETTPPVTPTQE